MWRPTFRLCVFAGTQRGDAAGFTESPFLKTCSGFHFEGRGAGLQLVTGWHRGNAGKRGVAFTAGAATAGRGGAKGKAQTERCVLQISYRKTSLISNRTLGLGPIYLGRGGARRRQAITGCCWGMGVARAGGSSAWTILPEVGTWRTEGFRPLTSSSAHVTKKHAACCC